MRESSASKPDPDVLIQHYLEDCLTEEEARALLELLQQPGSDAQALGASLLQQISTDAMLGEARPVLELPSVLPAPSTRRAPRLFTWTTMGSVAALAACVTLGFTWLLSEGGLLPAADKTEDEATTAAVAVLARGVNLEWEGTAHALGSALSPGWLRLKSGLAQIEFYQGARVTLEGPAAFRLLSAGAAYCSSGKLSAHVPPQAKGFRIDTPQGTIVDLGTDFGLDLSGESPEVHVFKGEVELHALSAAAGVDATAAAMPLLREGQGRSLGKEGRAFAADATAFASLGNVDQRNDESQRLAFETWLTRATSWNQAPGLLMRLDFQDRSDTRALRNHATDSNQVPPGSIVGGSWTEGRWPGKRALEFRNISDRVRLTVPGDHSSVTLAAWVRVQGLDRAFNSLFMVEGFDHGAVHWQITREGRLRLGLAGRDKSPSRDYDTPPLFTPERFGQWTHLATVIDPQARQVLHYMNGEEVARVSMKAVYPVRLGLADLGNWNNGSRADRVAIRHFSGAMDEFMLFSKALSNQEILRLARLE